MITEIWNPLSALIASVMRTFQVSKSTAFCIIAAHWERDHSERLKHV